MGYHVTLHDDGGDRSVDWPNELKAGMEILVYGRNWTVFEVDPKLGTARARAVERRRIPRQASPSLRPPPKAEPGQ